MADKITPLRKSGKAPSPPVQSSGPKTSAGKARASQNAVVHGATSPKLLGDTERARYAEILTALRAQYPSTNPLVQMQLERIARLKIQLDRVQDVIVY